MAEPGPQAQCIPALNPPPHPPNQPELQAPQQPTQPAQHIVHLNWSHFKPEFSRKPEGNAEAHLLCTNNWMKAHHFIEGVKVQRFCLTLLGYARL